VNIVSHTSYHPALSPIEEVIEDARNGRMFILVDAEERENEGDLVIPAQMATPDAALSASRSMLIAPSSFILS